MAEACRPASARMLQWVPASAALLGMGVGGAGLPHLAMAQAAPAQAEAIDTTLFDGLIADLAAGNRQAALNRIAGVETHIGRPMLVANRGQFVDLLLGCNGTITGQRTLGRIPRVTVEWQCANGVISASLMPEAGRYIHVYDITDQAERDRRAALPTTVPTIPPPAPAIRTVPPPAPPPVRTPEQIAAAEVRERLAAAERAELLNAFGAAVQAGSLDVLADRVTPQARFSYGYRDPFNSVNVNDLQGQGIAAGNEAVAAAIAQLGTPTGFTCEHDRISICRWTFAESHRGLVAMVFSRDGRISSAQLLYVTPEALALAAQNATPEQIEAYLASQQAGGAK